MNIITDINIILALTVYLFTLQAESPSMFLETLGMGERSKS